MIECQFEDGNKAKLRHATCGAIIVKDNKIMMVKRSQSMRYFPGKFSWPGGILERDETLEEGVLRELQEETGYKGKVSGLFLINDNPQRDEAQNVDYIFIVEDVSKVSEHDHETESIHWFDLDNLPDKDQFAFDHYDGIQLYRKYTREKFIIPVLQGVIK